MRIQTTTNVGPSTTWPAIHSLLALNGFTMGCGLQLAYISCMSNQPDVFHRQQPFKISFYWILRKIHFAKVCSRLVQTLFSHKVIEAISRGWLAQKGVHTEKQLISGVTIRQREKKTCAASTQMRKGSQHPSIDCNYKGQRKEHTLEVLNFPQQLRLLVWVLFSIESGSKVSQMQAFFFFVLHSLHLWNGTLVTHLSPRGTDANGYWRKCAHARQHEKKGIKRDRGRETREMKHLARSKYECVAFMSRGCHFIYDIEMLCKVWKRSHMQRAVMQSKLSPSHSRSSINAWAKGARAEHRARPFRWKEWRQVRTQAIASLSMFGVRDENALMMSHIAGKTASSIGY